MKKLVFLLHQRRTVLGIAVLLALFAAVQVQAWPGTGSPFYAMSPDKGEEPIVEETPRFDAPGYELVSANGAQRTYRFFNTNKNGGSLYYTAALQQSMPEVGSNAYTVTSNMDAEVTVSGQGYLYAYVADPLGETEASYVMEVRVNGVEQTLPTPGRYSYYNDKNQCIVVEFWLNKEWLEGYPNVTFYYSLDGGDYQPLVGNQMNVQSGQVLSYYASAPGYNNSPTATITVGMPIWNLNLQERFNQSFYGFVDGSPVSLGQEKETGLYELKVNGTKLNDYLLTPNENLGSDVFYMRNPGRVPFFMWEGGDPEATCKGGTVTATGTNEGRVNTANSGNMVIQVKGKMNDIDAGYVTITFDRPLAEGDQIFITGYKKKASDEKANVALYMRYCDGQGNSMAEYYNNNESWTNIADGIDAETGEFIDYGNDGTEPVTHIYNVPADADGATSIILARSVTQTDLYILNFTVMHYGYVIDKPYSIKANQPWRGRSHTMKHVTRRAVVQDGDEAVYEYETAGLFSSVDRTYAVANLVKDSYLIVEMAKSRSNVEQTLTNLVGLELDEWNSEYYNEGIYAVFRVTQNGTGRFTLSGNNMLAHMSYMQVTPPEAPYLGIAGVSGANRTVVISKNGSGTLHYTTTLQQSQPEIGSAAFDGSTTNYVAEVTVSGQGYLYAYVENASGCSEVSEIYVNGVAITLNAPYIYNKWYDEEQQLWNVSLRSNQDNLDGSPYATIYYQINDGEATAYKEQFTIANGATLKFWAQAEGYTNSPAVEVTTAPQMEFTYLWYESYTYQNYPSSTITLGDEVETGLYQMKYNNGNYLVGSGHLLTPNENINDNFRIYYYDGLKSAENRTYALTGVEAGQYVRLYNPSAPVLSAVGAEVDTWQSDGSYTYLRVTTSGTIRFTLAGGQGYLENIYVYKERTDGDVDVADANGNKLRYHYETAEGPATFTYVVSYAEDAAKYGHIIIADEVTDKNGHQHPVKYIRSDLSNRYDLRSVVFGSNIEVVGTSNNSTGSFYYCRHLKSVTLNAKLDTLGRNTFYSCDSLVTINLTAATNLRTIADNCFNSCSLTSITLPSKVDSIGNSAFSSCNKLVTADLSAATNLKNLPSQCFYYNQELTTITLPTSLTTLGYDVFGNCYKLESINLEATSLTALPESCFESCSALTSLTLPNTVTTLGRSAFNYCNALTEINFGTGLVSDAFGTDNYDFYGLNSLEKMTLPGANFPFAAYYYNLPQTLTLWVNPDLYDTYVASEYTKNYHIIAIGSQTTFAVTTTADSRLAMELAKQTEMPENVISLTVKGPINGTDINTLHQAMPFLEELDLGQAQIVEGGDQYARWYRNGNVMEQETWYGTYSTQNDSIGMYMFAEMQQLKKIVLPAGATGMGEYALYNTPIQQVVLPSALKNIGSYAFYTDNTSRLRQIDIPTTVQRIGEYAFYRNALESVVVPEGVTRLETYVFYGCRNLKNLTLPSTLTFIGNYAFSDCDSLKTVNLPDAVTSIGNSAFSQCDYLQSINMPAQLTTIGNSAFYNNRGLSTALVMPNGLTSIGSQAFYKCENLPAVTFNEGLTTIGNSAFYYCYRLAQAELPESLTSLGSSSFYNCDSLRTFTFPSNIKQVPQQVLYSCDSLKQVTLAEGTTSIYSSAFNYCTALNQININQSTLTRIDDNAFSNTGFTSITLPNEVSSLGSGIFSNCLNLQSVNVPTGVTTVPYYYCSYCPKLTQVTMHDGILTIQDEAFYNCYALESIELNDQITSIGGSAFNNCRALQDVHMPSGLKTLSSSAFNGSALRSVTLPAGITTFGTSVFANCDSLRTAILPSDMTALPNYTFRYCDSLTTVILPDGLQSIGNYAFDNSGLKNIDLPLTLKTIGTYAFQNSRLEEIHLPLSLTSIGNYAFYKTNLREIVVPKNVTTVGAQFAAYCSLLESARLGRKMDYSNNSYFDYFNNCNNLKLLRVYAGTPPKIRSSYVGYRTNCVLEVPQGQESLYTETGTWNEFKEIRHFESEEMLNDLDYIAMRDMYRQMGGEQWTKQWDISNQNHSNGKWNGVSTVVDPDDDELFYITSIDLSNQGLTGQLPRSLFQLPHLQTLNLSNNQIETQLDTLLTKNDTTITTLNLSGNHLSGDVYLFATKLTKVTNLDLSYNWITDVSQVVPKTTLTTINLNYQFIDLKTKQVSVPEALREQVVNNATPGEAITLKSYPTLTYRHSSGDFGQTYSDMYRTYVSGTSLVYGNDYYYVEGGQWKPNIYYDFRAPKQQLVAYVPYYSNRAFILNFDWSDGDVNADKTVDVADLQNVLHYALNDNHLSGQFFNYTDADANADNQINVSDVVGNINRIMNYEEPAGSRAHVYMYKVYDGASAANIAMLEGTSLRLSNTDEVAAMQITISGASAQQIKVGDDLIRNFQVVVRDVAEGARVVVYSMMGSTLAAGSYALINALPEGAAVADIRLVDGLARHLSVALAGDATAIERVEADTDNAAPTTIYDLSGRRMGQWNSLPSGIYIISVNGKQYKVRK